MKTMAETIINPRTGVTYISVKDLISFLDGTKSEEQLPEVTQYIDELIVSLATMRTAKPYS